MPDFTEIIDGPLDGLWVSTDLGDLWPAATWVKFGSHSAKEHLIGDYKRDRYV